MHTTYLPNDASNWVPSVDEILIAVPCPSLNNFIRRISNYRTARRNSDDGMDKAGDLKIRTGKTIRFFESIHHERKLYAGKYTGKSFSLILAALFALSLPNSGENFSSLFLNSATTRATFMSALKMVIVPLVAASIISGVMQLGADKSASRMGGKTLLYYTLSGASAVIIGLLVVNLVGLGRINPEAAAAMLGQGGATVAEQGILKVEGREAVTHRNPLTPLPRQHCDAGTSNGRLLHHHLFSPRLCIGKLPLALRTTQENWEHSAGHVLLTTWIIRFAPIGVFGLVTPVLFNFRQLFGAILFFFTSSCTVPHALLYSHLP